MARKSKLSMMSVEALFNLRDDVAKALADKASELRKQLSALIGTKPGRGRPVGRRGRKVPAQFRSKKNPKATWSGRGVIPRWMKVEMKGTKLTKDSFRIK